MCRVICMGCGELSPREPFQEQLAELNPEAAEAVRKMARAGPDAEAARQRSLRVGAGERDDRVGAAVHATCGVPVQTILGEAVDMHGYALLALKHPEWASRSHSFS